MNESFAEAATGPPTAKHGDVSIQTLMAHSTRFWLDSQQHGIPLSTSISNTHNVKKYNEWLRRKQREKTIRAISGRFIFPALIGCPPQFDTPKFLLIGFPTGLGSPSTACIVFREH